ANYRREVYQRNLDRVKLHNSAGHSWWMELNQFAALTPAEFKATYLGLKPMRSALRGAEVGIDGYLPTTLGSPLPATFNWQDHPGILTPVKNQAQCGSCWAFSTSESIESATAIATGTLTPLSEQQLVDCAGAWNNQGCDG
ncbi:Ctsh, partial [Symbiodinium sp. KB8]